MRFNVVLLNSSVPVNHDNVTVSQHAQHQDPETETAKSSMKKRHIFKLISLTIVMKSTSVSDTTYGWHFFSNGVSMYFAQQFNVPVI